jgi:hypothetical protein
MKKVFFFLALTATVIQCDRGKCYPSKGSRDYATITIKKTVA